MNKLLLPLLAALLLLAPLSAGAKHNPTESESTKQNLYLSHGATETANAIATAGAKAIATASASQNPEPQSASAQKQLPKQKITRVVNSFKGNEDFEVVKLGSLAMATIRTIVSMDKPEDPEDYIYLDMLKGIKSVLVVDYSGAASKVKSDFEKEINKVLEGIEPMMSTSDEGEEMIIYGTVDEDGEGISDFLLISPTEYTLVLIGGKLNIDQAMLYASEQ